MSKPPLDRAKRWPGEGLVTIVIVYCMVDIYIYTHGNYIHIHTYGNSNYLLAFPHISLLNGYDMLQLLNTENMAHSQQADTFTRPLSLSRPMPRRKTATRVSSSTNVY